MCLCLQSPGEALTRPRQRKMLDKGQVTEDIIAEHPQLAAQTPPPLPAESSGTRHPAHADEDGRTSWFHTPSMISPHPSLLLFFVVTSFPIQ